ncbi:MAG: Gfo/Idh/MocA family oxidoreductase [Oscillospiraceae bacterium]|nr:Gfo/Idh/MocA family oxidoreductase [Oscillospiraceae bacterium]
MSIGKNINIAVIGTGFMGRTHSYSSANLPFFYENLPFKAVLHTICSRDKQKGEQIKNNWGFLNSETDIDKILKNKEIDVIDICTPNIYHFDTVIKALEAGKNIYCEKPLVISSEQADKVIEKFEEINKTKNLICSMVFHNRFAPAVLKAKQLISDGKLGQIISFRCAYLHNSNIDLNKNAGWKQTAGNGGGVLFDLGSHAIDLVRFLCCGNNGENDIISVSGKSQIFFPVRKGMDGQDWHTDADEAFYITAQLKSGATGSIEASKLATGTNSDLSFEIYGEKGAVKYNIMQPNYLEFYDNTKPDGDYGGEKGFTKIECVQRYPKPGNVFPGPKAPVGWVRFHMHSMYIYLNGVYQNSLSEISPSFYDGAAVQKIIEKARLSDKTGKWETV